MGLFDKYVKQQDDVSYVPREVFNEAMNKVTEILTSMAVVLEKNKQELLENKQEIYNQKLKIEKLSSYISYLKKCTRNKIQSVDFEEYEQNTWRYNN